MVQGVCWRFGWSGTGRPWPCRAHAATEHVRADDEKTIRVDRLARSDHPPPPAGFPRNGMRLGNILVTRQRVTDQYGVVPFRRERPVSPVGYVHGRQNSPAIKQDPFGKRGVCMLDRRRNDSLVHKPEFQRLSPHKDQNRPDQGLYGSTPARAGMNTARKLSSLTRRRQFTFL